MANKKSKYWPYYERINRGKKKRYKCLFDNCGHKLPSYQGIISHIKRTHGGEIEERERKAREWREEQERIRLEKIEEEKEDRKIAEQQLEEYRRDLPRRREERKREKEAQEKQRRIEEEAEQKRIERNRIVCEKMEKACENNEDWLKIYQDYIIENLVQP